jgi:hypothetical protein
MRPIKSHVHRPPFHTKIMVSQALHDIFYPLIMWE